MKDTRFTTQSYSPRRLAELLDFVSENARSRWPDAAYLMNSDVIWQLPETPEEDIRLWYDDRGLAAYAWFRFFCPATMDLRTDLPLDHPIAEGLLGWIEARRQAYPKAFPWLLDLKSMGEWEQALADGLPNKGGTERIMQLTAFDGDSDRLAFLEDHGYYGTGHFGYFMARSLDTPIPEPELPPGMRLRHVLEKDFGERVAAHRDAWFHSSFSLEAYLQVRALSGYDPELDLVAETAEGNFASYCIGWLDHTMKVGSFEPVGTRPAWRRRGLGRQVNLEGLRRMKARGMANAKIGTAGFNDPAFGLYTACGFDLIDRERTYVKVV